MGVSRFWGIYWQSSKPSYRHVITQLSFFNVFFFLLVAATVITASDSCNTKPLPLIVFNKHPRERLLLQSRLQVKPNKGNRWDRSNRDSFLGVELLGGFKPFSLPSVAAGVFVHSAATLLVFRASPGLGEWDRSIGQVQMLQCLLFLKGFTTFLEWTLFSLSQAFT